MTPKNYSEDELVEQSAIELFRELGWDYLNCFDESAANQALGRDNSGETVLKDKLEEALWRLNNGVEVEGIASAIEELSKDRSTLNLIAANAELYKLIKDGVNVQVTNPAGEQQSRTIKVIDWDNPANNDFLLTSQLWITGEMYKRRADLIGFINGLPLLFIELKAVHKQLENAFRGNLRDYKDTIPHIFWHNAFIILSNGGQSRLGTLTSGWEHFTEWKRINSEGEKGRVSLETIIRGTCDKQRCLDLIENFIIFKAGKGGTAKIIAKNHQYLGVNNAVESVEHRRENQGRLGVVWHTQGAGKSISMIFFSEKVLRKLPGNYTFLIVTDRKELDGQIYKNFADSGVVIEKEAQATSAAGLKQLLMEDHRHIFTLIQKFRAERGDIYPKLSGRSDIIVITDEAHRSQYDTFAMNMRNALPNAAFIGFTGTPLIAGEEKTREVFGDYISVYNFRQSIDDQATVPLYYENRTPELQLKDEDLFKEDLQNLIDEAELDEGQERRLEREFAKEYHLITRDARLEKVSEDTVDHFMGRGYLGKAMVVSVDKATALRMYDKVKRYWLSYIEGLRADMAAVENPAEREHLEAQIKFMEETEMAVVVSQSQNEIADMKDKGLDIAPHRAKMVKDDLETRFKDVNDPFRLVFVCAMWMTGFDAPDCSTIYLDKPMRNHTLMQTIARANRVYRAKPNGLIVDYLGIFRNLQKALAIYGAGGVESGDHPAFSKDELVEELRKAVAVARDFCVKLGIDLAAVESAKGFDKMAALDDAVEKIIVNDETEKQFIGAAGLVLRIYKGILPDTKANEFVGTRDLFFVILEKIRALLPPVPIDEIAASIDNLLDQHVAAEGYVIKASKEDRAAHLIDLSRVDFEALQKKFATGRRATEAERLKNALKAKVTLMLQHNPTRQYIYDKLMVMIDEYNHGSLNIDQFFKELIQFGGTVNDEDKRAIAENLTEEELAVFDLLTRPKFDLSKKEIGQVKKVARDLLKTLNTEKLVLDWRKKLEARAAVRVSIEDILNSELPEKYNKQLYDEKCDRLYQHIYDNYYGEGLSVYSVPTPGIGSGIKVK